jgi:HK97 family phage prohead protease
MSETKRLDVAWDGKLEAEDDGTFSGYGSVFNVKDAYADVVMPGAFTRTLTEARSKGRMPMMLWQHDYTQPIGKWSEMSQDDRGLRVKGQIAINTRAGRDAYELLKMGALDGLSIGFRTRKYTWNETSKVRELTDVDLVEVSPVAFPANDAARVQNVKSDGLPTIREIEDILRDAGLSRTQAKALLADGYHALRDAALDPDDPVRLLRAASQELRRDVRNQERAG